MRESQSKILRNVFFKIYEWLSLEYRKEISFDLFYETEMKKIINEKKDLI